MTNIPVPINGTSLKDEKTTAEIDEEFPYLDGQITYPTKEFYFLPIPVHLRYDPSKPFKFSYVVTFMYAIIAMIVAMNLYYCQPLLIEMAKTFDVSYESVSRIPTFTQAGYAVGLLLLCPLGDTLRRRQLILFLVVITLLLSIGLAVTNNVIVFQILTSLVGLTNIAGQILAPLVAEIAPPERRAFAFSIVLTGIMLGILLARVIAGIIGQFIMWRIVYYTAFGAQCFVFVCLYFILPDYPAKNNDLPYWKIHWSMVKLAVTEPLAAQVIIVNLGASACFAYYWVTLTFLLDGQPYHYSTLQIGLFGLIGMAGVAAGPLSGRIIDRLHPWYALLLATIILLLFQAVQTAAGGIHISAVIISCFGLDLFQQIQNVGLVIMILSVSQEATSRLNALYMISYYVGQIIGTSVGTKLFVQYGWRAAGAFGMAVYMMQIIALLVRGPHCKQYTWFGYEGGLGLRETDSSSNSHRMETVARSID